MKDDLSVNDLKNLQVWTGMYKGFFIKIHRHFTKGMNEYHIRDRENWCYYISWNKDRLDKSLFNFLTSGIKETEYFSCNYTDSPLSNLKWHCGCTYGKLIRDENAELQVIELGCDYNHYWDEGKLYGLDNILSDAKSTVDDFISQYPDYLSKPKSKL